MSKKYFITSWLGEIGWTNLEYGDPPMGVAGGAVIFTHYSDGYDFFIKHQLSENIEIYDNIESDQYFNASFKKVNVISDKGIEIQFIGLNLTGCPDETNIDLVGIPYPFYEQEFPEHCEQYKKKYNDAT